MLTTSAHHNVGRTELLLHIARLRALNELKPAPDPEQEHEPALEGVRQLA